MRVSKDDAGEDEDEGEEDDEEGAGLCEPTNERTVSVLTWPAARLEKESEREKRESKKRGK